MAMLGLVTVFKMVRCLVLCLMLLLLPASDTYAEQSEEWLAEHKIHVNNCYVKRKYQNDGTFVLLESNTILESCTWLWKNSRDIDWFSLGIRAYEYRKLGKYEEALDDINSVIQYFRTATVRSSYTLEEHSKFDAYLQLMRDEICADRFQALQVRCER